MARLLPVVILTLIIGGSALTVKDKPKAPTLREWLAKGTCLNLGIQPLMNTQFMIMGIMDALRDEGLSDKVTGMTGVSSGAFISAIYSSKDNKNVSRKFRETWPGWGKMGYKDPEMSENYAKFLKTILPTRFEDLKTPLTVSTTLFDNDEAAANIDNKHADSLVANSGNLIDAIVASSSTMFGTGCPHCTPGFSAKKFRGLWPVADGFLKDEYGTAGFHALPKCDRAFRIVPMYYEGQCATPAREKLDTQPKEMVTLIATQPMSSVSSVFFDVTKEQLKFLNVLGQAKNDGAAWEAKVYEVSYKEIKTLLDQPMEIHVDGAGKQDQDHFVAVARTQKALELFRKPAEKLWDLKNGGTHGKYWASTEERRNDMVAKRNKAAKAGGHPVRLAPEE